MTRALLGGLEPDVATIGELIGRRESCIRGKQPLVNAQDGCAMDVPYGRRGRCSKDPFDHRTRLMVTAIVFFPSVLCFQSICTFSPTVNGNVLLFSSVASSSRFLIPKDVVTVVSSR